MQTENSEPTRAFIRHYPVALAQADPVGRMRVSALAEALMDSADHHARQLNCDIATLQEYGVTWMVTGIHIRLMAPVRCADALTVTTWPKAAPSTLIYYRDFSVENARGETVALASSAWVLLDRASLRVLRGNQVKQLSRLVPRPDQALPPPERVRPPQITPLWQEERRSRYADLDMNGHVTTRRYFEWVEDALEKELLDGCRISEITMDFARQILPAQRVLVSHLAGEEADWVRMEAGGKTCLTARIRLEGPGQV